MAVRTSTTIYGTHPTKRVRKEAASNTKKKIYGLSYPLSKNIHKGYFSKESGRELVYNNLKQLLRTDPGERVMLPNFGCSLNQYLFQPMDGELFESIKETILTSITRYARNVEVLRLGVFPLDDYGLEGLQALQIKLLVQLRDDEDVSFDVEVKIG